jgi:hypothetical protein
MLIYYEWRKRINGDLYKVRSWYLCGLLLIYRRWEQLTTSAYYAIPSEM